MKSIEKNVRKQQTMKCNEKMCIFQPCTKYGVQFTPMHVRDGINPHLEKFSFTIIINLLMVKYIFDTMAR